MKGSNGGLGLSLLVVLVLLILPGLVLASCASADGAITRPSVHLAR